jgi:hypothetical protein
MLFLSELRQILVSFRREISWAFAWPTSRCYSGRKNMTKLIVCFFANVLLKRFKFNFLNTECCNKIWKLTFWWIVLKTINNYGVLVVKCYLIYAITFLKITSLGWSFWHTTNFCNCDQKLNTTAQITQLPSTLRYVSYTSVLSIITLKDERAPQVRS